MEVRAALRKSTWNQTAMMKSPSAILKDAISMSDRIQQGIAVETKPGIEEMNSSPVKNEFTSLPVINYSCQGEDNVDMEVNNDDSSCSTENEEDMLEATDVDEESVNISASSSTSDIAVASTSRVSVTSRLNVTGDDGKIDLEKIKKWKVPRLDKSKHGQIKSAEARRSSRLRRTLPFNSQQTTPQTGIPQAASTPHPKRLNRSLTLQAVQDNLRPSKLRKKEK